MTLGLGGAIKELTRIERYRAEPTPQITTQPSMLGSKRSKCSQPRPPNWRTCRYLEGVQPGKGRGGGDDMAEVEKPKSTRLYCGLYAIHLYSQQTALNGL